MGKRLTRIVTRTGDDGTTGLGDGSRVPKDAARIAAMGDVDELNSTIGVLAAEALPPAIADALLRIQHDLFDLGGELSIPGFENLKTDSVTRLDELLETFNASLPRLQEFILPGGSRPAALAHVSRTVCRRAERSVVSLGHSEDVRPLLRHYLNRLSDLLFVMARTINRADGGQDVLWQHDKPDRQATAAKDARTDGEPAGK